MIVQLLLQKLFGCGCHSVVVDVKCCVFCFSFIEFVEFNIVAQRAYNQTTFIMTLFVVNLIKIKQQTGKHQVLVLNANKNKRSLVFYLNVTCLVVYLLSHRLSHSNLRYCKLQNVHTKDYRTHTHEAMLSAFE